MTSRNDTMTVVVYSDNATTRRQITLALGQRPVPDLPALAYLECATQPAVIATLDAGGVDVCVLDGEAAPAGGMGICRQLKDEIDDCPPVLMLIGRAQDGWLATWSGADAMLSHPLDPMAVRQAVVELARQRSACPAP